MNYTIVGGGIAAYSALKWLKKYDSEARVTIVSEEEHCFYYRPMTPLVIKGDRERDEILFDEHLPNFKVIHDRAQALDAANRKITLAKNKELGFEQLLIATGSIPVVPDVPGINADNVYYLRTLSDAELLKKAAGRGKKAVILGGGLVGVKKAEALNKMGLTVTIVEQQDQILFPRLDWQGAEIITENLEKSGISVITGDSISMVLPDSQGITLASGKTLEADLVCIATGVKPNIDWLHGSGLETDLALVVDEKMQTNIEGIYGAGDVVQTTDRITGKKIVSALWTNAVEMGKIAGINMAGRKLRYDGSLEVLNSTEIEGIPLITAGNINPEDDSYEVISKQSKDKYEKLIFHNDRLTGAIFLGDISGAGVYTSLIKTGIALGNLKDKILSGDSITYTDFLMKNSLGDCKSPLKNNCFLAVKSSCN